MSRVPRIRFKGFEEDWEQRKLISCLSLLKDGTHGTHKDYPSGPLLLSAKNIKNGRVYYDETDRRISYKDFEKIHRNFKLQIGDILLTIVGSIGETALLKDSFEITFQRSVAFLRANDNILPKFLMSEFNTDRFRNELEDRKSTSAQPGIYLGDLGEIPVFVSKDPAEQRRVGSYFESLDHLITLHQRKLEKLKIIKKSMLENLFPQNGEKTPKIRFSGFTEDWEQRKTSELFKITRGYVLAANIIDANKSRDNPYPVYSSQTKDNGLMGYYKDYLYENAITWTTDGANAGTVNYRDEKFYCTNVCGVLLGYKVTPNQMLSEAINIVAKSYVSYVGNPKLMNNVMAEICIWLPSEETERKAISSFVYSLDHLITLHQSKLEKLQKIKKSMLESMFV